MKLNRRDFLKMGGGAGIAFALGGGFWKWTQSPPSSKLLPPGIEKWIPTICGQCLGGCGVLVRVIDGWATNIIGNPLHPINRGTLCPKGIAGLQGLYDPDRIRSPLKRIGKRGEGRWQPISWKEAIQEVSKLLRELRKNEEAHRLTVLGGRYRGLMRSLWDRFLEAYGSPNYIDNQFRWDGIPMEGFFLTQGIHALPVYDFENVQYLLSFGVPLLDSYWFPIHALKAFGHFRRGRPGQRGKLIQIEPRLSITGIKADEWVPIHPGSEGILALGIAHMIIKEGLYDKEFVSKNTFGFENWVDPNGQRHLGFQEYVLSEFPPHRVSSKTGIPIDTLIRLSREFATNQPSLAIGYRDRPFHQMAVAALNGLMGNIDRLGGVLIPKSVPLKPLPSFIKDGLAQKGLGMGRIDEGRLDPFQIDHPYLFAKNSISDRFYRPKVLFLYYSNPLFSNPHPDFFQQAFDQIPFIVSFSPYLDDTTQYADLVLPDHTPLERWQDDPISLNNGYPVLGIRQPTIQPIHQTRATGDVLIDLAKSLGGEIEKAFPWKDFKEVLLYSLKGIVEARRGDVFGLEFDEAWTRMLQRGGWWDPSYKSFEEFWELLLERGGWWNPLYEFGEKDRIFKTPSKKFEFYSQTMKEGPFSSKMDNDSYFLPHWEESKTKEDEKTYPLFLNIFKSMALGGRNANQPWLQGIVGPHLFEKWTTWVEINPKTASEYNISDGDWVWVESPHGKIKAKARLYQGAMPQVINIPFGNGHRSGGRWSKNIGENPYQLLELELDHLTRQPIQGTTRVRIYKV